MSALRTVSGFRGDLSFLDAAHETELRDLLLHSFGSFASYREHLEVSAVTSESLLTESPSQVLSRIGPFTKIQYRSLQSESLDAQAKIPFVIDPSSGTTGSPVLKFASPADDRAEVDAVLRAFTNISLPSGVRCAALDVGASQIYLFYLRALRTLGVSDSAFVKLTADPQAAARALRAIDPGVLITIPSVLKRCLIQLETAFAGAGTSIRSVICIGEPLDDALRARVYSGIGAECFSFYGTTEVGSVCMECSAHRGMHIPTDLFVPTLFPPPESVAVVELGPQRYRGVIAWTSLRIRGQPVIKYAVNDLVEIDLSTCSCGLSSPRLTFLRRTDESFFLFGITFTYGFFEDVLSDVLPDPVLFEVRVGPVDSITACGDATAVTLAIDDCCQAFSCGIRDRLCSTYPLSELILSQLVDLRLNFVSRSYFTSRKTRRVVRES